MPDKKKTDKKAPAKKEEAPPPAAKEAPAPEPISLTDEQLEELRVSFFLSGRLIVFPKYHFSNFQIQP